MQTDPATRPLLQPSAVETLQMQSIAVRMGLQPRISMSVPSYHMPDPETIQQLVQAKQRRTCAGYAAEGAIKGAALGTCWGLFEGTYLGSKAGIKGLNLVGHTAKCLGVNIVGFATCVSLYSSTYCACEKSRGIEDWTNAAIAGSVAGGVMAIPMALKTGNSRLVLLLGAVASGMSATAYSLKVEV
mmetsp:Transcript_44682/g.69928  ORF Transcript_44682/g.69928 Transcript_44682/m.69928 type:complete len:186 (+) Transcript_44682:200-757(+)